MRQKTVFLKVGEGSKLFKATNQSEIYYQVQKQWDVPGGSMVKTLCFKHRGPGFIPGQRAKSARAGQHGQKKKKASPLKTEASPMSLGTGWVGRIDLRRTILHLSLCAGHWGRRDE